MNDLAVAFYNLSQLMRLLFGFGTPKPDGRNGMELATSFLPIGRYFGLRGGDNHWLTSVSRHLWPQFGEIVPMVEKSSRLQKPFLQQAASTYAQPQRLDIIP